MKKMLAIVLSLLLIGCLMAPAFAVDGVEEPTSAPVEEPSGDEPTTQEAATAEPTTAETTTAPTTAESTTEADSGFDIGDLLSNPIVQAILASQGASDIITIVLQILPYVTDGGETLKNMATEEAVKIVEQIVNEVGKIVVDGKENAEVFLPDPLEILGQHLGLDVDSLTTTVPETDPEDELEIGMGDVDGDGKITAADARLILRRAARLIVFTDEQDRLADVNGDGKVTAADARIVLRVSAKLQEMP